MFPSPHQHQPPSSFPAAPGSPTSPSHKRHILHEDRDMHEIKRRMGGLRFGEEAAEIAGLGVAASPAPVVAGVPATAMPPACFGPTSSCVTSTAGAAFFASAFSNASSSVGPGTTLSSYGLVPPFPPTVIIPGGDYSDATANSTAFSAAPVIPAPAPTNEEEVVAMDSDESGDEEEEEGGGISSQSSSISRTSSTSSSSSSVSRIDEDDPRAVMLSLLYKRRRPPRDRVEAKIENLIRYSLLRANPGGAPPPMEPLSLCDKPWQAVEGQRNDDGGMDSSPDLGDEGGMDL